MKINTLGKLFFGALAANAVAKYLEPAPEAEFSESETDALLHAVDRGDYQGFERLYRSVRPGASDSTIAETYGKFARLISR